MQSPASIVVRCQAPVRKRMKLNSSPKNPAE
jgi:hypothetical protein